MKISPQTTETDRIIISHGEATALRNELAELLDMREARLLGGFPQANALHDKLTEAGR